MTGDKDSEIYDSDIGSPASGNGFYAEQAISKIKRNIPQDILVL